MRRFTRYALLLTALVATLFQLSPAARADEEVERIFHEIRTINKGLEDYQANIEIALNAKESIS